MLILKELDLIYFELFSNFISNRHRIFMAETLDNIELQRFE